MRRSTILLFGTFFLFSFWLMFHTFSYDSQKHAMMVSQKVWSDFGQQIPLIRSFSLGSNWPPQFPLFPGELIHYHFLFYFLVGVLEKIGLRIDWALNIPSAGGFFLLLCGIFLLAKKLFKDERIAVLSIIFFLFNGSLSYIYFFQKHPLSVHTLTDIISVTNFSAFAPWDTTDITAFWNLNIYTNQRHLALAFGLAILFLYTLLRIEPRSFKKQLPYALGFGVLFGIFPYFHQPTLAIVAVCEAVYFLLFPKLRAGLYLSGLVTLAIVIPQLALPRGAQTIAWFPGYLARNPLTIRHVIEFWWLNLGLHSLFIPLGWLLAPQKIRKFFVPIFVLFIIANLFKFSPEVAANHKFFNFVLILGNMLTAYTIVWFWSSLSSSIMFIKFIKIIIVTGVFVALTLSGVIDFFVVANDVKGSIPDIPINKTATWIVRNTPKDAVFLNSSFLYHPASIAGRNIFLGWPYFAWSEGYDTNTRLREMRQMYAPDNLSALCKQFKTFNISYVTFQTKNAAEELDFNEIVYRNHFSQVFSDQTEGYTIYSTKPGCK